MPSIPLSCNTNKTKLPKQLKPEYIENGQREDDYETELRQNEMQVFSISKYF